MPVVSSMVTGPAGSPSRATVTIRLVTASSTTPGYTSSGEIVGQWSAPVNSAGEWSATLVGNDSITPAGTYYEIVEAIPATGARAVSAIVVPTSGGPYTVADLLVTAPAGPDPLGATVAYVDQADAAVLAEANAYTDGHAGGAALQKSANLADLTDVSAARTALGIATVLIRVAAPTGIAATDTAAIQAALDAANTAGGGIVQLQPGTYRIQAGASGSLGGVRVNNNTTLAGAGLGITVLQVTPGTSVDITGIVRTPTAVPTAYATVQDLTIDGNAANVTGTPVIIGFYCGVTPMSTQTDTDIACIRVEAKNCTGYGFDPHERTTRARFVECLAHGNGTDGFTLDANYDFVMVGCTSYGNTRHGFNFVTASQRGRVVGCTSAGNGSNGYTLQNGAKTIAFEACRAYSNAGAGWVLNGIAQTSPQLDTDPGGRHALIGCSAALSGTYGVQVIAASNNRIESCESWDASQAANGSSSHFLLGESGSSYSQNNTLIGCTWGSTAGSSANAKYGVAETSASDGPNFVLGCSGAGMTTAPLNLLHPTSLLAAAHNGSSGGHPAAYAYANDTPARHNLVEWNFPPDLAGASAGIILVAGTIYGQRIDVQAGTPVANIVVVCGTIANALTAGQCIASVINASGAEVARSGDISGLFGATGAVTIPLVAGFTPTAGQAYAVLLLFNGGTPPSLVRSSATSVTTPNVGLTSASPRRFFTAGTVQTAMPSTVTLSATTATGALALWVALS